MLRIASIIVVLSLLFGGTGVAVVAAQDSLPGEALYTLKTTTEDIQLMFIDNEEERLVKALDFVNTRYIEASIKEMEGSVWTDRELNDLVQRLEENLNDALLAAAAMEDTQTGLTTITDQIKILATAIQKRPQDQASKDERGDGSMVICMWREAYEDLTAGLEDPLPFTEMQPTCHEEMLDSLDLLVIAGEEDLLMGEPVVDGDQTPDQSINSDQGQSYGSQDPQAQNGAYNDPAYAVPPVEDRNPFETMNKGTSGSGPGPGVSGGSNSASQYQGNNGTQSQDSGSSESALKPVY
jgi:hypothetical protein